MSEIPSALQVVLYPPKLVGATTTYGPGRLAERSLEILCYSRTSTLTEKITETPTILLRYGYAGDSDPT